MEKSSLDTYCKKKVFDFPGRLAGNKYYVCNKNCNKNVTKIL